MGATAIDKSEIFLRMDDVGASTKEFEVYSKFPFCNFLFLKRLPVLKAWGPYREMLPEEWDKLLAILEKHNAKLTVGVTACWVDAKSNLIPFPEMYPNQAEKIKNAWKDGILEVGNHGLTHCVVGKHLPMLFASNRTFHREFWDWLPNELHFDHLERSQRIIKDWLGEEVSTFIPPGNVYSEATLDAAKSHGIRSISTLKKIETSLDLNFVVKNVEAFHDREIVLYGVDWLEKLILSFKEGCTFEVIKDHVGENIEKTKKIY